MRGARGRGGRQGGVVDVPNPQPDERRVEFARRCEEADVSTVEGMPEFKDNIIAYTPGSNVPLEERLRSGTLVLALLHCVKWNSNNAYGKNHRIGSDILLQSDDRGEGLPGDVVAVAVHPRERWANRDPTPSTKSNPLGHRRAALSDGRTVFGGELVTSRPSAQAKNPLRRIEEVIGLTPPPSRDVLESMGLLSQMPSGRVVAVVERRCETLHACTYADTAPLPLKGGRYYRFKSYNESFPHLFVFGRDVPSAYHDRVATSLLLVELIVDAGGSIARVDGFPQGRVVRSLGQSRTVAAESMAIALSNGIKWNEFGEDVERCVMANFQVPNAAELQQMNRRDLRDEFVCSIDPPTARDLDDALSISVCPGGYRVGIHIADVSHFVPLDSALDVEAQRRSTSVYFIEKVIPMLPRRLCEDYCSLNEGSDKFAFSIMLQMDKKGNVVSEWFGQSVIRNRCRMSYDDAQRIIDGDEQCEHLKFHSSELTNGVTRQSLAERVKKSVLLLYELATVTRKARFERGALALNKKKLHFVFTENDKGLAPSGWTVEALKEANWVIEEFMLLGNIRTAMKIAEFLPQSALLRRHEPPQPAKMSSFRETMRKNNIDLSAQHSKGLCDALERYRDDPRIDAMRMMLTLCMQRAQYIPGQDEEVSYVGHYALQVDVYTHFTSPIRRYADLVVHRQLLLALDIERVVKARHAATHGTVDIASFDVDELPHGAYYVDPGTVSMIAERCNTNKEHAKACSTLSSSLFLALYIDALNARAKYLAPNAPPPLFRVAATVVRIQDRMFTVFASEIGLENFIYHNSRDQRWICENVVEADTSSFSINWGMPPSDANLASVSSENVTSTPTGMVEKISLFSTLTVQLEALKKITLTVSMKLDPPWRRSTPGGLPRTLNSL